MKAVVVEEYEGMNAEMACGQFGGALMAKMGLGVVFGVLEIMD